MWNTLAQDFDPIPGINRGFGGSILPEVIHYADRIIFPYQPKLIVLYCGENDVADGATAVQVLTSFIQLDEMIRSKLPETKMIYISMKPSIARWKLWEEYSIGNEIIHEYIKTKKDRFYLDCSTVMLLENGEPDPSIFVEDNLHMNAKGYEGWTTLLKPMVEKLYN
jgi:lysophospholipase L1-like esterase